VKLPRLLADIGGTHARFASQAAPGQPLVETGRYACADFPSLEDALRHHLQERGLEKPRDVAIGIATPITGDHVAMTNNPWAFSIDAMKHSLGAQRLLVINDFTALALSLSALPAESFTPIGPVGRSQAVAGAPLALLGAGTGLGVSGLLPAGHAWVPLAGEGGHVTIAATTAGEEALLRVLRERFTHVSAERVLSGQGIENLYRALVELQGVQPALNNAREIGVAAREGRDALAVQALQHFSAFLGQAAGNLALTLGARGGVYVGGGIVPQLGAAFDQGLFRQNFEAKGRFANYLSAIPTLLVQASDEAALLGASVALN